MLGSEQFLSRAVATVAVAAVLMWCVGAPSVFAQDDSSGDQKSDNPPPWAKSPLTFGLTSYAWLAGVSGDVGVGGLPPAEIDVKFEDIFNNIDWWPPPIMLAGEVRYDRFALLGDIIYLGLAGDGTAPGPGPVTVTAEGEFKAMIMTLGGSYRVVQGETVDLDLLAGGRLWMMDTTMTLTGPLAVRQAGASEAWFDPLVGVAGQIKLGAGFAIKAEGDVGGFGVGADLDWQVLGTVQYQVDDSLTLQAGYRYLAIKYDDNGLLLDIALQGPIIGGSIRF